jgi:hypothetical protein
MPLATGLESGGRCGDAGRHGPARPRRGGRGYPGDAPVGSRARGHAGERCCRAARGARGVGGAACTTAARAGGALRRRAVGRAAAAPAARRFRRARGGAGRRGRRGTRSPRRGREPAAAPRGVARRDRSIVAGRERRSAPAGPAPRGGGGAGRALRRGQACARGEPCRGLGFAAAGGRAAAAEQRRAAGAGRGEHSPELARGGYRGYSRRRDRGSRAGRRCRANGGTDSRTSRAWRAGSPAVGDVPADTAEWRTCCGRSGGPSAGHARPDASGDLGRWPTPSGCPFRSAADHRNGPRAGGRAAHAGNLFGDVFERIRAEYVEPVSATATRSRTPSRAC